MTSEDKKSIRAAAGVLACLAALGFGAIWRDRDLDKSEHLDISNLVASTSDRTELPETKFFEDIMELLKRKYVDPITDDTKLSDGAVRGMVASLGDPNSLYMDADQYRVYNNVRSGKYEGIGADLVLARDRPHVKVQVGGPDESDDGEVRLPRLMIAAVVPGGVADKAGLKPGDCAEFVDDHWIPNSEAFDKLDALAANVKAHKAPSADFLKLRRELRDEAEKNIYPIKARDRLMIGAAGSVKTEWMRGDQHIQVTLTKGTWEMPPFGVQADGSIRLPFVPGSAEKLRQTLNGRKEATIDLRNNVEGDLDSALAALKVLAPNGTYGFLLTHKEEKPVPLTISDGSASHPKLTLLVDRTTRGAAEIFALALSTRGISTMSGPAMAGNPYEIHWFQLPDGAGYTLVTGEYRTTAPTSVVAARSGTGAGK